MNKTTEALKLALEKAQMLMQPIPDKEVTALEIAKAVSERALELCQILEEALVNPVKQEPVAVISESAIGLVKLHSNGACLPFGTQLYAAPVSAPKQEPVAWAYEYGTDKSDAVNEIRWYPNLTALHKPKPEEGSLIRNVRPLYAAPVSAEAIRAEALEEAAKVCEEGTALTYFQNTDCYNYAHNRAKAIRSLK